MCALLSFAHRLDNNALGAEPLLLSTLCDALHSNTSLTHLSLSHNGISDRVSLQRLVRQFHLRTLLLDNNESSGKVALQPHSPAPWPTPQILAVLCGLLTRFCPGDAMCGLWDGLAHK